MNLMRWSLLLVVCLSSLALAALSSAAEPARVDTTTLHRKVMCGYQGWFRAPGDGTSDGWTHWSRNGRRITPETLTFEMWPEMSEYGKDERFPAGDFIYPDGSQADLFSSANAKTVERHFAWMRDYGIDGAFVQRFLVEAHRPSTNLVLDNVRAAAEKSGRAYAVCYDLTSFRSERIVAALKDDWQRLVDERKITSDKQYLHHNGRPVLFVWGFFSDRFDAAIAHELIDFLQQDEKYRVKLIGGCQWQWRTEKNAEWAKAFRRLDVISPWNVGHVELIDGKKQAATHYWKDDLAAAKEAGCDYLPVIYPGFGWTNLKGQNSAKHTIPRQGGEFYWRQFSAASDLGIEMAYVAMFDEVDEATAIFKVTNNPPTQAKFATYEGLPADWYLRLTGEGAKLLRGERKNARELPMRP